MENEKRKHINEVLLASESLDLMESESKSRATLETRYVGQKETKHSRAVACLTQNASK